MLVNRIFVIGNSTRSTGRQVDRSTSRQINIAKIYEWIGRYSPSGNTRAKCMMGKKSLCGRYSCQYIIIIIYPNHDRIRRVGGKPPQTPKLKKESSEIALSGNINM